MGPKAKTKTPGQGQKQRKKKKKKKVPNEPGERKRRKREHMERRRAERAQKDSIDLRKLSKDMRELKRKCYGEDSDIRPLPDNERLIAVAPASKRTQQCIRALATLHGLRVQARSRASTSKRRRVMHVTPPVPGSLGKTAEAALREKSPSWEQVETLVLIYEGKINKFAKGRATRALGSKGEIRVDQDLIMFVFGGTSFGKNGEAAAAEGGEGSKENGGGSSGDSSDSDTSDSSDGDGDGDGNGNGDGEVGGNGGTKGNNDDDDDDRNDDDRNDEQHLRLGMRRLKFTNGDAMWKGGQKGGIEGESGASTSGYKWERHSTGIGRQLMMKMGFGGAGKGKGKGAGKGGAEGAAAAAAAAAAVATGSSSASGGAGSEKETGSGSATKGKANTEDKKEKEDKASRPPLVLFHKAGLGATGSGITEAITLEDTGGRLPGASGGTKGKRKGKRGKRKKDLGGGARRGLGYKGP